MSSLLFDLTHVMPTLGWRVRPSTTTTKIIIICQVLKMIQETLTNKIIWIETQSFRCSNLHGIFHLIAPDWYCGNYIVFFFPSVPSLSSPLSALSIFCPSPVTLCHPLAKLGPKPGCKSCPTGLECRGSGGPWLNWHMHHRVWGMTPRCQTLDPSNITNFTERRKLVMGDTFGTLKGDFLPPSPILFQTWLSVEHVILLVDYF